MTPRRGDLVVGRWGAEFLGRRFACSIGRGGIGEKSGEGDMITPRGVFHLDEVWVRPDRARRAGARLIGLRDAWCEDTASPSYNRPILRDGPAEERLRRSDPLYDLIGVMDFNMGPVRPGAGSAIFLHMWRRPRYPTAGCIGFARRDLEWILHRWNARSRIIVR